ncbi:glycosyltransferase family 4 protein [Acaryochloris sp. 'Moss Beach']|uniref:glycosyltransferase family 4 protein n=1 Tax=Acaryochloris sp. 'Moss Beach' TaxID=2740837 RepID=UPI001F46A59C|nr:glycosyltransferase family 4 protein [Acaryochloris sp. 'Moss Beach']UJB69826.1 glycosyltransferase family 4 protein [Acaryochloris sp. 'Moss Beach']
MLKRQIILLFCFLIPTLKNIRLGVFTQFFPPDYAPTGQLIDELTQHLSQQDIQVKIFSGQPGYAFRSSEEAPLREKRNQVFVRRSRTAQLWPQQIRGKAINGLLFFIRAGLHLLRSSRKYDVILLTTAPPFLPFLGYLASLILRKPYICLVYDLYPDIAIELNVVKSDSLLARLWCVINYLVWNNASAVIVLSEAMKKTIARRCPKVREKISVIHSWADPTLIAPIPKNKNWFAWKHQLVDIFTVIYSGNMGRCHDMDTLLDAILRLRDEPIQFVFIGGGAKRPDVMAKVKEFDLLNCLFLPYQEKDVLPYSLTAGNLSLVSVSPGMQDLVAPSKVYSALSSGRPIAAVCPKDSYLNALISDANCGTTFENGDGNGLADFILYLQKDPKTAKAMGDNAHHFLEKHFTPQIISKEYFSVVNQCITENKKQKIRLATYKTLKNINSCISEPVS